MDDRKDAEEGLEPALAGPLPRGSARPEPIPIVRAALRFYALLFAAGWLWCRLAGRPLLSARPRANGAGGDAGLDIALADVALGLAAAACVIGLSELFTRRTRLGAALATALADLLGRRTPLECVLLALVSGISEEAFFRGAMQPQFGLVATSLLFGVVHFVPRREFLPWTVFALAAGFLLGGLFEVTGNLVAPIVAHVGINAVNLWLLTSRRTRELEVG